VPGAVAKLQQRFPRLVVEIVVGVNDLTLPRLLDGDLDLVFGALPQDRVLPPYIDQQPITLLDSRVVAGSGHPLQKKRRVHARDLAAYPWAIYQQDRDTVGFLFTMMREEGAEPPRIAAEVNSLTVLLQMLKSGPYLSCFADLLVAAYPDPGLAIVPFDRPVRRFPAGALVHRSLENYAPAKALLALVREGAEAWRTKGARLETRD
jgi:DNA-binding transcriptional LysR family regulator